MKRELQAPSKHEAASRGASEMHGIVIAAPQGAGKSRRAPELLRAYGKRRVIHEWSPGDPLPPDALALTNVPGVPEAIPLADALLLLR